MHDESQGASNSLYYFIIFWKTSLFQFARPANKKHRVGKMQHDQKLLDFANSVEELKHASILEKQKKAEKCLDSLLDLVINQQSRINFLEGNDGL